MENFLQKLSLKLSNFTKCNWGYLVHRTKLYFLPIIAPFKLINRKKEKLFFLMDKNNHYGFLIETIVLKLELMKESWPEYKNSYHETNDLKYLIDLGHCILEQLEQEDSKNHLRSSEYLKLQKKFFDALNQKLPGLFY